VEHVSPALLPTRSAAAYELKFLVTETVATAAEEWAREHLELDPHALEDLGSSYRIQSIYLDTAELDVFHRTPGFRRRKYRLRRYGDENWVYLERKTKTGQRVRKRRQRIELADLPCLKSPEPNPDWVGNWFQRRVQRRRLQPRCLLDYRRTAFVGVNPEGPLRLTLDRHIRSAVTNGHDFQRTSPLLPIASGQVVLELKFCIAMPALFKGLVEDLQLTPKGASKYRQAVEAWGLARSAREVG
jgi:hypothetical protein